MIEELHSLYGYIEKQLEQERDWLIRRKLEEKLKSISILLESLPYNQGNVLEEFEREII